MAEPIVGENSIGMRLAWRSFPPDQALGNLKHLSIGRAASVGTACR